MAAPVPSLPDESPLPAHLPHLLFWLCLGSLGPECLPGLPDHTGPGLPTRAELILLPELLAVSLLPAWHPRPVPLSHRQL